MRGVISVNRKGLQCGVACDYLKSGLNSIGRNGKFVMEWYSEQRELWEKKSQNLRCSEDSAWFNSTYGIEFQKSRLVLLERPRNNVCILTYFCARKI